MTESTPITKINGIGEVTGSKFAKLGIFKVGDLINSVPRRYQDYSNLISISQIRPGVVTIKVKFGSINSRYSKRGLHITETMASDRTGSVKIVWFNQPYRAKMINPDNEYYISGEYAKNYKFFAITNPACELVSNFPINTARIVPVYALTKGLGLTQVRRAIKSVINDLRIAETLPKWLIDKEKLMSRAESLRQMHFPKNEVQLNMAKRRLGFEEVFELTLASEINKESNKSFQSVRAAFNKQLINRFVKSLPFKLTNDQKKVAWRIFLDLESGIPMNRLVEGDVGSGKTLVAVLAMLGVADNGFQSAFMAPTELLAVQHYKTIMELLEKIGLSDRVVILSGGLSAQQKQSTIKKIKTGKAKIIIGTHSLFQKSVHFNNLGLAVIDEQHRFGVEQRKKLQGKGKQMPHVLNMTATPIPRSLTLTLFGEMDVSIISQIPKERKKSDTKILQPEQRKQLYDSLKPILESGEQLFVVCPMIEENAVNPGRSLSVETIHKQLKSWYSGYSVGLLHGKLKPDKKNQIMQDFIDKKYNVLVSTTVIEVGVDVPNATVMVIEGADRFGLAQLHQLRGRVGRGEIPGRCYLVMTDNGGISQRLRLIEQENDGFKLAEYDLDLRGPGAIYGTIQHGALDLRVAKLSDLELIKSARVAAKEFIQKKENLLKYKQLKERVDNLRAVVNLN